MVIEVAQELHTVLSAVEQASIQSHGYDLVYRCADGECLCGRCVQDNKQIIVEATTGHFDESSDWSSKQWSIIGVESASEYEEPQKCANCYRTLQ